MNKIYTDLYQSKKLLELGIDVDTADIYLYEGTDGNYYPEFPIERDYGDIPAWSLNSLLNIIKNRKDCNKVELFSNYSSKWVLIATYYDSIWKEKEIIAECPIDAAFEMICFLKENNML